MKIGMNCHKVAYDYAENYNSIDMGWVYLIRLLVIVTGKCI